MIKFKNWILGLVLKGALKHHKDICAIVETRMKKLEDKLNKKK